MAAMLAGYTRMTYSLAVIVMETCQAINIYLPVILTIGIANYVGGFFTRGLYDRAVRGKQMPLLKRRAPDPNRQIRAETIMSPKVITLRTVESVKKIYEALQSPHHGFPVVNMSGQVVGLISKNYLIVLIKNKNYYSHPKQKYFIMHNKVKKYLKGALTKNDESYTDANSQDQTQPEQDHSMITVQDKARSYKSQVSKAINGINQTVDHQKASGSTSVPSDDRDTTGAPPNQPFSFRTYYDLDVFPQSDGMNVLPWTLFTRDFLGLDLRLTPDVAHVCKTHQDQMLDLRPYLIENPEVCSKFDFLPKVLQRFRHMNLRHLVVINPVNSHVEGMITRQDIFRWMPL